MDASTIDQADLDRLTDKDKQDLRQFIQNEQQRTRIQARMRPPLPSTPPRPPAQSHDLTETCFKKCVTGSFKNGKLDKGEEACLTNCVDRFMDNPFDANKCHNPLQFFTWYPQTLPNHCNSPLSRRHLDKGQLGGSDVKGIDVSSQTGVSLLLAIRTVIAC
ncbi:hypothetical protein FJTKL_01880 [Diaporthe vaccinii]|uniref:Tim10-like domain-containing protein n=1 Tax=Diaporthe vaccinii TaxID=105482 RepID=A0ABR4F4M0_9PEZI